LYAAHLSPLGPWSPFGPTGPCAPCGPRAPCEPTGPDRPCEPLPPCDPPVAVTTIFIALHQEGTDIVPVPVPVVEKEVDGASAFFGYTGPLELLKGMSWVILPAGELATIYDGKVVNPLVVGIGTNEPAGVCCNNVVKGVSL
jgi:hypothetical protein